MRVELLCCSSGSAPGCAQVAQDFLQVLDVPAAICYRAFDSRFAVDGNQNLACLKQAEEPALSFRPKAAVAALFLASSLSVWRFGAEWRFINPAIIRICEAIKFGDIGLDVNERGAVKNVNAFHYKGGPCSFF